MSDQPGRLLLDLVLVALAAGGLFYGLAQKHSDGFDKSQDEQFMELYRRIEALDADNQRLLNRVRQLEELREDESEATLVP